MDNKSETLREMLKDLLILTYEETMKQLDDTDNRLERIRLIHEAATTFGFSMSRTDI